VKFSDQVVAALKKLHPGARRDTLRALDDVNLGKKRDVHALTDQLAGFWRLRVGKYRVVMRKDETGELIAEFLGPRNPIDRSFQPPAASN
jgi:mRNA interferase RelE/StbE